MLTQATLGLDLHEFDALSALGSRLLLGEKATHILGFMGGVLGRAARRAHAIQQMAPTKVGLASVPSSAHSPATRE